MIYPARFIRLALSLTVLFACSTSWATYIDGNKLLADLKSTGVDGFRQFHSQGYIIGVVDTRNRLPWGEFGGICFETPENATAGQVADVVRQFLERRPSVRHLGASFLVAVALSEAFPCRKQ
jgi:hypothetical protein